MMGFLISIHVVICVALIIIILIQAGRGGGLVEGFSGVESMFGPKTSAFLTRATTIFSTLFLITCVSLALLSAKQSKSLMSGSTGITEAVEVDKTQAQDEKPADPAAVSAENISKEDNQSKETAAQEPVKQEAAQTGQK